MTCPTDMVARAPGLPKDHAACIMRLASPNRDSSGAWLSPVERTVRDREVEGSNPFAPTKSVMVRGSQVSPFRGRCKSFRPDQQ